MRRIRNLNPWPHDLKSRALPTELTRPCSMSLIIYKVRWCLRVMVAVFANNAFNDSCNSTFPFVVQSMAISIHWPLWARWLPPTDPEGSAGTVFNGRERIPLWRFHSLPASRSEDTVVTRHRGWWKVPVSGRKLVKIYYRNDPVKYDLNSTLQRLVVLQSSFLL